MDVTPALASLFLKEKLSTLWSKLDDDEPLSQLCSKYWGKKIEFDAEQWRKSNSIVDDPTNDIGPGCFALDLGIDNLTTKEMWVRQDYIRIYDYCNERHAVGPSSGSAIPRSVVITGQPGIGKTFWVTYATRRRLGEEKPFLWYQDRFCFIFIKGGVFKLEIEKVSAQDFVPFLWTFVDADQRDAVPDILISHNTKLYIMFVTSPQRLRWKRLKKSTNTVVIVMNTWHLGEMRQAAKIFLENEKWNLVEDTFKRYGPVARTCINYVQDGEALSNHDDDCQNAAQELTAQSLRRFVISGGNLDLDAASHTIFMVNRREVDNLKGAYIQPISAYVEMLIMRAIDNLERLERITLYRTFALVNTTRVVAGLLYESLGHERLAEGVTLTLKPMVKTPAKKYIHWKLPGELEANAMDLDNLDPVTFPRNPAITYEGGATSVEPDHLYIPRASNQVAFDSFFVLGDILYVFQFTLADSHDIKEGIAELLSDEVPPMENWCFVFITPPGSKVDVKASPAVENFLGDATVCLAHLEVE